MLNIVQMYDCILLYIYTIQECMHIRMRAYRIDNTKHLFAYIAHGEGMCQADTSDKSSWRCELTCETIPISVTNS